MSGIDVQKTKEIIESTLKAMGVSFDSVEVSENTLTSSPKFMIKSKDSAMLIGIKGANLFALNHLIKKIVSKGKEEDEEGAKFFIDVNDYHEKVEYEIRNKARIMADRARSFKTNIELEPMSSYERMVVHSFLQDMKDIKTESVGFGKTRRVVIKYVEGESPVI
jgi:spoIIIJ-associated protein